MTNHKIEPFFNSTFDDGTLLKLEIFSGYIREWLPVFLTRWKKNAQPSQVFLYDFFAGAGTDENGNPGSPILLVNQLKNFCQDHPDIRSTAIKPTLLFNDSNATHIALLQQAIDSVRCPEQCCNIRYSVKKFHDALKNELPEMQKTTSACLAIMDQFGLSEITEDVILMLDTCPKTDFMFFITSSFISRFSEQKGVKERFNLKECTYSNVHRAVCDYYKSLLPKGSTFNLAPFSIRKKNGNIYGIIFGSHHLYGLEKFLQVCWNKDKVTGEANYDIDNDGMTRFGQMDLFGNNQIKKIDRFESELLDYIKHGHLLPSVTGKKIITPVNNRDIYRFTLERGFLPKHARAIIVEKNKTATIIVKDKNRKIIEKPKGLYLSHDNLYNDEHTVFFSAENQKNEIQ